MRLAQAFLNSLKKEYIKELNDIKRKSTENDEIEVLEMLSEISEPIIELYKISYPDLYVEYENISGYILFTFGDYVMKKRMVDITEVLTDSEFDSLFLYKPEME
jgi:hypothetical protein